MISEANFYVLKRTRRVPFPHMGPADARVWRAALQAGLMPADRYEYDVRLGGKAAGLVPAEHEHAEMWAELLRKRVDVVAWRGDVPWIVEVKPIASFAALGQCLGYRSLWMAERRPGAAPRAACVCAICDADLEPVFGEFGVSVFVLPPRWADAVGLHLRGPGLDSAT